MNDSIELTIAFLLYLLLFGWIGYRRGLVREMVVFAVGFGSYLFLWRYASALRTLINLFWKFLYFARAGGLAGNGDALDLLREAPNLVRPEQTSTVVFLIWAALLLLTYLVTNMLVPDTVSRPGLRAALVGMVNGLVYLGIFLPLLASLVAPEIRDRLPASPEESVLRILGRTWALFGDSLDLFWDASSAQRPFVFMALVILLLVLAARSLRPAT